jgi:hypothetical protein
MFEDFEEWQKTKNPWIDPIINKGKL